MFAPTNDAFTNLPDNLTQTITGNATILNAVLSFHATSAIFRLVNLNIKQSGLLHGDVVEKAYLPAYPDQLSKQLVTEIVAKQLPNLL